jgi:hypothetical protein
MSTPKRIIFYHNCFAIPAEVWWAPEHEPVEITLKQAMALDLPRDIRLTVGEKRDVQHPDTFLLPMDTLHSIIGAIRDLGVRVFVRVYKKEEQ